MGCGDMKEKIENEMVKTKMERVEVQMERKKQLNLLKEIDGCDIKLAQIPDYINVDDNLNQETKKGKKDDNILTSHKNKKKVPIKLKVRKSKSMRLKRSPIERRFSQNNNRNNLKRKKTYKI